MSLEVKVIQNRYVDSVSLMALSTRANQLAGVAEVIVAMATEMNKEVMKNVGLFNQTVAQAQTSDLLIAVNLEPGAEAAATLAAVEALLDEKTGPETETNESRVYNTIAEAKENLPAANLALISVNGHYATREGMQALNNDLNVMMFSDNVSVADEIKLKALAQEKGLLMMGPDCGTAIINGTCLGFANEVRRGSIGIVGASGTGSQEVAVRIHEFGGGVSQLIGTGGRDLSEEVGGVTMLQGIDLLEADPHTKVIVLISKPPAKSIQSKIIEKVKTISKPVVIWFVGNLEQRQEGNLFFENMSKNTAIKAVELSGIDINTLDLHPLNLPLIEEVQARLQPEQKYIRGLFSGGTLCAEAYYAATEFYQDVYSNVSTENPLPNKDQSQGHTFIDFGADEFTDGKPHPMIDPTNRIERFRQEAKDPEVGVILLDFVLGYGAHPDPVGVMVEEIINAKENARQAGRELEVIGYVLGTENDSQNIELQVEQLEATGAIYASSSQNTGLLGRGFVKKGEAHD